jgi:hypothetical protein
MHFTMNLIGLLLLITLAISPGFVSGSPADDELDHNIVFDGVLVGNYTCDNTTVSLGNYSASGIQVGPPLNSLDNNPLHFYFFHMSTNNSLFTNDHIYNLNFRSAYRQRYDNGPGSVTVLLNLNSHNGVVIERQNFESEVGYSISGDQRSLNDVPYLSFDQSEVDLEIDYPAGFDNNNRCQSELRHYWLVSLGRSS